MMKKNEIRNINKRATPEGMYNLFLEHSADYALEIDVIEAANNEFNPKILATAYRDRDKALERVNGVLDICNSLGFTATIIDMLADD